MQLFIILSRVHPHSVHVCNVGAREEDKHYSLDLLPQDESRFCAFAVRFSNDGNEIVAS